MQYFDQSIPNVLLITLHLDGETMSLSNELVFLPIELIVFV